jgi:protein ImuA
VVGPPKHPHLPGLIHEGLDQRHLVWIQADAPAERLWVTEQLIKSNAAGAVISWLPQARQEQIRRLQIGAQGCDGLVFLFRPESAQHEASAAPLRVHATYGLDWELRVHVFKRRGPIHDGLVVLPSVPGGLSSVLTPRLMRPSQLITPRENVHAVGSLAPRTVPQPVTTH